MGSGAMPTTPPQSEAQRTSIAAAAGIEESIERLQVPFESWWPIRSRSPSALNRTTRFS
jgi:hypothetical protein